MDMRDETQPPDTSYKSLPYSITLCYGGMEYEVARAENVETAVKLAEHIHYGKDTEWLKAKSLGVRRPPRPTVKIYRHSWTIDSTGTRSI